MNHNTLKKLLTLILLTLLLGVAAIHKVIGEIPPEWFVGKFSKSLIGKVPGGITGPYLIIILLELAAPLLFLIGIFRKEFTPYGKLQFIRYGFLVSYILFIILTFGSFLVEDYSNGFFDFMYFVGAIVLEKFVFSDSKDTADQGSHIDS